MLFNNVITYAMLLSLGILLLIYFPKTNVKSSRRWFFLMVVFSTTLHCVSDVLMVVADMYVGNELLTDILWKLRWIGLIGFFNGIYYYAFYLAHKIELKNIKELYNYSFITKFPFYMTGLELILFLTNIVKSEPFSILNRLDYTSGPSAYLIVGGGIVYIIIYHTVIHKNKKNVTSIEFFGIVFTTVLFFVSLALQMLMKDVSFTPAATVLICFCFYCNAENPDLRVLQEIGKSRKIIDDSNNSKTQFLLNMTDEIKVPLGIINSVCKEINSMNEYDENKVKSGIDEITTSSYSLLDTMDNLLNLSNITSGENDKSEINYSVLDLIKDFSILLNNKTKGKKVTTTINIDPKLPSILYGDSSKIYQIIANLISNAAKYTSVGKIIVSVSLVSLENDAAQILFAVSDSGEGIKAELLPTLFEKNENNGMGLFVSKTYADELNGKIWAQSEINVGSKFYLQLYQKVVDFTNVGISSLIEEQPNETKVFLNCSGFNILVVDDNQLNSNVLTKYLKRYNFNVSSVKSGLDCIRLIKSEHKYDLILMDDMMPEISGVQTLQVLMKLPGYEIPPVVCVTANAMTGVKKKYLQEGFSDYLSKPVSADELDVVINKFFKIKK